MLIECYLAEHFNRFNDILNLKPYFENGYTSQTQNWNPH